MLFHELQNCPIYSWNDGRITVRVFDTKCLPNETRQLSQPLYFEPGFISISGENSLSFVLDRNSSNKTIATFHCTTLPKFCWVSPTKAPFGGIALYDFCTAGEITQFLKIIKNRIKHCGALIISITSFPKIYFPVLHATLHRGYIDTGFRQIRTLRNQYLLVGAQNFTSFVHDSARRRIAKCERAGFVSGLDNAICVETAYNFLAACRQEKGYSLSIKMYDLVQLKDHFPEDLLIFVSRHRQTITGIIITIRVTKDILYNFLTAYNRDYATYSPVIQLTQKVYEYGRSRAFRLLDLGTSLDHLGEEKKSLVRFKKNMGALSCSKNSYQLTF